MRAAIAVIVASLLGCADADDSPKRACSSTLKGDYQFEACGAFCKEAKKANHCKFCKCKACTFCAAGGAASAAVAPPALSPRNRLAPPPPRWPKKGGKKGGKVGGMGGTGTPLGGEGKQKCQSGIKGDLPFMTCAAFCKSAKATNHCKFCKCRSCQYCTKDGAPTAGAAAAATATAAAPVGAPAGGAMAGVTVGASGGTLTSAADGMTQRGVPVDRVASTGASHARLFQGVGVAILLVMVGLGMVAFTSQGDAEMGTWRHTVQTHLAKMGLASHGVEGNRLNREEETSDLDAAFRAVDKLEAEVAGNKR